MTLRITAAALALVLASGSAPAQQTVKDDGARIEQVKAAALAGVEARKKLTQVMNDTVFSFGELGYQEYENGKYLTGLLEKNGFTVERGLAGMPTAWVAKWGSGHPILDRKSVGEGK